MFQWADPDDDDTDDCSWLRSIMVAVVMEIEMQKKMKIEMRKQQDEGPHKQNNYKHLAILKRSPTACFPLVDLKTPILSVCFAGNWIFRN